jgi:hypothetical protein
MEGPNINEWGPALWRLFHTFAERIGHKSPRLHVGDEYAFYRMEYEVWLRFMNSLLQSIPCSTCKQHFTEYIQRNPFETAIGTGYGEERRKAVREWFWKFHNAVRERKGQSQLISLEAIPHIYSSYNLDIIDQDGKMVIAHMGRAAYFRVISQGAISVFTTVLYNLRSLY